MNLEKSKFVASEKVTNAVRQLSGDAARLLREGFDGQIMVNAFGIFSDPDPEKRRGELQAARDGMDYDVRPHVSLRLYGDDIGSDFTIVPYQKGDSPHIRWNAHAALGVVYKF